LDATLEREEKMVSTLVDVAQARWWAVLESALTWAGAFPQRGCGSIKGFLTLPPEVQDGVRKVLLNTSWPQAEVYFIEIDNKREWFVFGSKSRRSIEKAPFFPLELKEKVKDSIMKKARATTHQSLFGVALREEDGAIFLLVFPFFALFLIGAFYTLPLLDDAPKVNFLLVGIKIIGMLGGVAGLFWPYVMAWFKRKRISEGLIEHGTASSAST
jgi:hypothetical protein